MKGVFVLVQDPHEGGYSALVPEDLFLAVGGPSVGNGYLQTTVKECQFPEPLGENVEAELGGFEYLFVGNEVNAGSRSPGVIRGFKKGRIRKTPPVFLGAGASLFADLYVKPAGKGVHDAYANTVQPSGHLVGTVVELAAGMEGGHDHLKRRDTRFRMNVGGDASSVIGASYSAVGLELHLNAGAVPALGFINTVVDHFVNKMVQAGGGG